jgi:hypothetical protein
MSVRPIQSYKFSKERRTILPLLGERAGARVDVILASMMSWLTRKVRFHAVSPAENIEEAVFPSRSEIKIKCWRGTAG